MKLRDLTQDDWENIGKYVKYIKNGLGLGNWTIYIANKPCDKEYQASIAPVYGRKVATLFLCRNWPTLDMVEQKQTLIHEMLHLLFWDMQSAVDRLAGVLDESTFHVTWETYLEALEYTVDGLADILCRQFDDPPIIYQPE